MSSGLILGKFAPLHRGHQYLIETALSEVDDLIVVIYDAPDVTSVPLPVRAGWIRALYPTVEVIEAWDGPMEVGDTPEVKRLHESYIANLLAGRPISHFYSSEFYGEHMSAAMGAVDRRIDPRRLQVPVSATRIRENPFRERAYLDPVVYRDLVSKIVFLGAPSTGKTTLARALASHYDTVWMPEYGREYWEERQVDRRLTLEQLVEIGEGHRHREDVLIPEANRYLFVDTEAIITYMFSLDYYGKADPRLEAMAGESLFRYDLFFLCEDDIPYEDTWERSGAVHRGVFQKQIVAELHRRKIPFIRLHGTINDRMSMVIKVLDGFDRYDSIADQLISSRPVLL